MSKEFKVGIVALIAGAILYLGFNFLKGSELFSSVNSYYVVYDDIQGLTVSNQVVINGYAVGRVNKITLLQDKDNKLEVELQVNESIVLGKGSKALLSDDGLLGGKLISLEIVEPKGEADILQDGEHLKGGLDQGIMDMISEKAQPIADNLDSVIMRVSDLAEQLTTSEKSVKNILANVESSTETLDGMLTENRSNVRSTIKNVKDISESLIQLEKELKPLIGEMNTLAKNANSIEFDKISKKSESVLTEVEKTMKAINSAQGTAGKMIYDKALYDNLNKSVEELKTLLADFQKRPKHYIPDVSVFGGKKKKKEKK